MIIDVEYNKIQPHINSIATIVAINENNCMLGKARFARSTRHSIYSVQCNQPIYTSDNQLIGYIDPIHRGIATKIGFLYKAYKGSMEYFHKPFTEEDFQKMCFIKFDSDSKRFYDIS